MFSAGIFFFRAEVPGIHGMVQYCVEGKTTATGTGQVLVPGPGTSNNSSIEVNTSTSTTVPGSTW